MDVLTLLAPSTHLHCGFWRFLFSPHNPPIFPPLFLSSGLLKDKLIMSLLPTVTIKVASLAIFPSLLSG